VILSLGVKLWRLAAPARTTVIADAATRPQVDQVPGS